MDATTRTALIIAVVAAGVLLLLFGPGMMTGSMVGGGMMKGGNVGGISWAWTSAFIVGGMGVVLFFVVFRNRE